MKVSIQQLRAISEILWRRLEAGGYAAVELRHDYYWHIPEDSAYDLRNEPAAHEVGQLTGDWAELQRLLENAREPIAYDLIGLAALLRAIGEEVVA